LKQAQGLQIKAAGKKALDKAKVKVDELHHELHEEHPGGVRR
jgi:hypothetical protein